ncbi:MAG: peptidylprolyl isomerase, partial [Bacteroidota bacterium]
NDAGTNASNPQPDPPPANPAATSPTSNLKTDAIISTDLGDIEIALYDDTPKHKANFLKLAAEGYYNGTGFHRIIRGFMIQGGDPYSKEGETGRPGTGGPGYTQNAEIVPTRFHKKGALAAARQGDAVNPERKSSGSQFYIVHGTPKSDADLANIGNYLGQKFPGYQFSEAQKNAYKTIGGTPELDNDYTVFGEVVKGMDIVDKIATVKTKPGDAPETPVRMTVKVAE